MLEAGEVRGVFKVSLEVCAMRRKREGEVENHFPFSPFLNCRRVDILRRIPIPLKSV
jgi:hypothetical protein